MNVLHFPKQHAHINNRLKDIIDEIDINNSLLSRLKSNADNMAMVLKSITCSDKFLKYFSYVSSALCKYVGVMTEINCKLEMVLDLELKKWNDVCYEYDNCMGFISRQLPPRPFEARNEFNGFEFPDNLLERKFMQDLEYLQRLTNMQIRQNLDFSLSRNFEGVNNLPLLVERNNMAEYSPENANNEMLRQQLRGLHLINHNPDNETGGQDMLSAFMNYNPIYEVARPDVRGSFFNTSPNNLDGERKVRGGHLVHGENEEEAFGNEPERNEDASDFRDVEDTPQENEVSSEKRGFILLNEEKKQQTEISKIPSKQYIAHIIHAVSPSELYLCIVEESSMLMHKFKDELESLKMDKKYAKPLFLVESKLVIRLLLKQLGQHALYYSETENTFFRVQFINTNLDIDDNDIDVYLIDIGRKERVHLTNLHPMPETLKKYPPFAVKCHLAKIAATYSSLAKLKWSADDIQTMENWIARNEKVRFIIDECAEENIKSLPIMLYDSKYADCLNKVMRDIQAEKFMDNASNEIVLEKWNPMLESYESNMNTYDMDPDDPSCAIFGYVGKDYERLCREFRETGKCFKGISCMKEHVLQDEKGFTRDQEEVYVEAFNTLKVPGVDEETMVQVTHFINGAQFHCVLDESQSDEKETLLSLVCFMNEKQNVAKMRKLSVPPSVGQIVIARFPRDRSWYRAKVLHAFPEADKYIVSFVDYGNVETVNHSNVRAIEPQYLHLPFQAILCELEGVRSTPEMLEECIKYLDETLTESVKIKIVTILAGERPHLVVRLYQNGDTDIGKVLIEKNFVLPQENMILDDNEINIPG